MTAASTNALRVMACAVMLASSVPGRMAAASAGQPYATARASEACPLHAAEVLAAAAAPDRFVTEVRPILEARCQPCHFEGGKMYASMPFDRPETIRGLGEKMFSRIKDEREAKVLRAFLAEPVPAH